VRVTATDDERTIPQIPDSEKVASLPLPNAMIGGLLWSALMQQRRSFARDARWAVSGLPVPLRVLGEEHVPPRGPCLVACNHYSRPGFDAWWVALAVSAALANLRASAADLEVRWVMTAAWTFPESAWKRRYLTPITRWAFACVARVYGFVPMPPMPPDPDEVEARAAAMLRTVRLARQIAPCGGGATHGSTSEADRAVRRDGRPSPRGAGCGGRVWRDALWRGQLYLAAGEGRAACAAGGRWRARWAVVCVLWTAF
jgi:hypothetical protein